MNQTRSTRYFDASMLPILGLAVFLLLSLPGGCMSGDGEGDDPPEGAEAATEPTTPPTMEIVELEPGDIQTSDSAEDEGEGDPESGDSDNEESGEDTGEQEDPPDDGTYVVQDGDTLYNIAVEFGVSMEELMAANGIEDPNTLQVGQELQIP